MINTSTQDLKQTAKPHPIGFSSQINIRKILRMMVRNWYFYLFGVALAITGAYFYMGNKIPDYEVKTTILIGEENAEGSEDLLRGFALRPGIQNLDNQLLIVKSYSLIRKAVEELPFEIDVYRKGFQSRASFYPMSPIRVELGEGIPPYDTDFIFRYDNENDNFSMRTTRRSRYRLDSIFTFGQTIEVGGSSFTIEPQPELENIYKTGKKIFIRFYDKTRLTELYIERLEVENATREGSILSLTLRGPNRVKDVIFLQMLTNVYIQNNLDQKNEEAMRVTEFITAQLYNVQDSLRITERELMDFRSRNMIMDVSAQAQQIIDRSAAMDNENARLSLERNYFIYLEEYLSKEDYDQAPMAPATMGITDPLLTNLMQELAGLQAEYFSKVAGERNPLQGQLEMRIRNTQGSIKEVLQSLKLANQMALDKLDTQIRKIQAEAKGLPIKEQRLLGFQRRFNLNNTLYTFLLQRRAESQIQSASNTSDNELVDQARATGPISPIPQMVFIIAFVFALGMPTLVILLKEVINNKITCEEDLQLVSKLPVVAHFPHSR